MVIKFTSCVNDHSVVLFDDSKNMFYRILYNKTSSLFIFFLKHIFLLLSSSSVFEFMIVRGSFTFFYTTDPDDSVDLVFKNWPDHLLGIRSKSLFTISWVYFDELY